MNGPAPLIQPETKPPSPTGRDNSEMFAAVAVGLAALAMVIALVTVAFMFLRSGSSALESGSGGTDAPIDLEDDATADPDTSVTEILSQTASAMAQVQSVEFSIARTGAPVFIDTFARIALESARGQFTVPTRARAELTVVIEEDLRTRLGAVAVDDQVWLSNPVTGTFEPLVTGYDLDPSRFFDPQGGWSPLLENLQDSQLVGIENDGGERYRVRGIAPADQVANITAGLVADQDVQIEFWIHPNAWLVTRAELETTTGNDTTSWRLEMSRYGERFNITKPEVGGGGD